MIRQLLILLAVFVSPTLVAAESPATAPDGVGEKNGVTVSLVVKQPVVPPGEQPRFLVRFANHTADYMNFNNGKAYCDWILVFSRGSDDPKERSRWMVRFDKIDMRKPHSIEQAKAGESCEVEVNLNDPLFTFMYERVGADKTDAPKLVETLPPGKYVLTATVAMEPFFIKDPHMWEGPVLTAPVEIEIRSYPPGQGPPQPTQAERAAYSHAIDRVTDQFDKHGLWANGPWMDIRLPDDASLRDVVASMVNQSSMGSKAFKVLHVLSLAHPNDPARSMTAALVTVGKEDKVFIFWRNSREGQVKRNGEISGWTGRYYGTTVQRPATQPVEAGQR